MKPFKLALFCMAVACAFLSCKKEVDNGGSDCEDNNTTQVSFTNTGTVPLRVQVAIQLTPQFTTINPVISLDLAPGQTVNKEIGADEYFIVWYSNCAASCSLMTYYKKTYVQCSSYEEKKGI